MTLSNMIYYEFRKVEEAKDRFYRGLGNALLALFIVGGFYALLWIAPAINYALK